MSTDQVTAELLEQLRTYFAARLGPDDAEDWAHEAVIAALEAARANRIHTNLRAYCWGAAAFLWRKALGQRGRFVQFPDGFDARNCSDSLQDLLAAEQRDIVRRQVALLSAVDREILERALYASETDPQIRAELGLTQTQLRLRKSRARLRLIARTKRMVA